MTILEELIHPLSLEEFSTHYLFKQPYAAPSAADRFRDLISWELLREIFATGHGDCWLPRRGRLPEEPALKTGYLTSETAEGAFCEGRTILVRHSERAHPILNEIAADFYGLFHDPVDIQLYVTPAEEEGFDWHYDVEDVFVIQSAGEKEFRLRQNRLNPPRRPAVVPRDLKELRQEWIGPEIRCLLAPGDWLYIPAGYWHKARALTASYHLSVGVLTPPS